MVFGLIAKLASIVLSISTGISVLAFRFEYCTSKRLPLYRLVKFFPVLSDSDCTGRGQIGLLRA
jgi:hypothetical protein